MQGREHRRQKVASRGQKAAENTHINKGLTQVVIPGLTGNLVFFWIPAFLPTGRQAQERRLLGVAAYKLGTL